MPLLGVQAELASTMHNLKAEQLIITTMFQLASEQASSQSVAVALLEARAVNEVGFLRVQPHLLSAMLTHLCHQAASNKHVSCLTRSEKHYVQIPPALRPLSSCLSESVRLLRPHLTPLIGCPSFRSSWQR